MRLVTRDAFSHEQSRRTYAPCESLCVLCESLWPQACCTYASYAPYAPDDSLWPQAQQRIAAQLPARVKAERASHTVDNSGGREAMAAQLHALVLELQRGRSITLGTRGVWGWARPPLASAWYVSLPLWAVLVALSLWQRARAVLARILAGAGWRARGVSSRL